MATPDYFTRRVPSSSTTPRVTRPTAQVLQEERAQRTPGSPRTPLLGRSTSSQLFGSPGSFRVEQDEYLVYGLGPRHFSAGFAGEAAPRCTLRFGPGEGRRLGDWRGYEKGRRRRKPGQEWGVEHTLFSTDLRTVDLALVEDRLRRALRTAHSSHLLLSDSRPRKAMLAVPSQLPSPLLEVALRVLFQHQAQPPSVTLLPDPILACVAAGVRSGLVVDVGWEETVVTAVYEYRAVLERRSIRGGKMLSEHMARVIDEEVVKERLLAGGGNETEALSSGEARDVLERMGWCKNGAEPASSADNTITIPLHQASPPLDLAVPFSCLAEPAETALFASSPSPDDHETALPLLAYKALLALPVDARAVCMSRILLTDSAANLPGLQHRLLQEVQNLITTRGWDPVQSYGSATAVLKERSANATLRSKRPSPIPTPKLAADEAPAVPAAFAPHDDLTDHISHKAERGRTSSDKPPARGVLRCVDTLGAWAGASLVGGMRLKGVAEVEREEFLKHGLRGAGAGM